MDATKRITKQLGGNRLGSGNKNNISMHAYNRSTHDLSYAWRSSMNVGTLTPFMKFPALNGETWSINLKNLVRTIPTIGPIYGSYKMQMDVFVCPMRLYNGLLHNNMTKIGLKMEQVKVPKLNIKTEVWNPYLTHVDLPNSQISPTALVKYMGISGLGDVKDTTNIKVKINRTFNAIPFLAYYDIYKNYYANKQEEKGVIIANGGQQIVNQLTNLKAAAIITQTMEQSDYNAPSAPPAIITTSLDTFQALETPIELKADKVFQQPVNGVFANNFNYVIETTTVANNVALTTYQEVQMATVFPNFLWQDDNIVLGLADTAYQSDVPNGITRKIYGVTYNATYSLNNGIRLQPFELENIDQARIEVLKKTGLNTELQLNDLDFYPYKALWEQQNDGVTANMNSQQGIAIKTYQSDMLQSWLQTEWIDGPNGINEITAIDVSSGSFTIDALNLANKVYNMLNRIAVSGGTYEDWQEAVYSTEAVRRAEQPIYVGGMSSEIVFEEIVSTAATEDEPLGQLAGKGTIANMRGGRLEIRIDEPSYIIGIASITPRIDYSNGNDFDMVEIDSMDDWHKPALDGIGFEDLLQERGAFWGTYFDTSTQNWVKLALGKTPAWINYMTNTNKCYGDFIEENKTMFMTLNRRYEQDPNSVNNTQRKMGIYDNTTYIDPSKYNYGFADTSLEAQNFWVQIGCEVYARRVMSAKQIPNL